MGKIVITNLNDGINVKNDPSAISEGGVVDCVGFDLTKEGVLETAKGLAANDISTKLPSGNIQWMQKVYIGTTEYVLATTSSGLCANGTLIDTAFTGRFKAISFVNNIYLVNGTLARRFNGTTCYQWGITAPTTMPTITAGSYLTKSIDTFEDLTTWIANQVGCAVSAEAVIKKEGTQSAHFNVAAGVLGYSYVTFTPDIDATKFSGGQDSTEKDYIRFWLYVDNLVNLSEISLFFDVGDGTFTSDYFSYTVASPGAGQGIQTLGFGKTADTIAEETTSSSSLTSYSESVVLGSGGYIGDAAGQPVYGPAPTQTTVYTTENYNTLITKNITRTVIDPMLADQVFSFWRRSSLFQLKSATYQEVKIPKSLFIQRGNTSLDWSTICALKIEITASPEGAVNVYFDGMKSAGGSDLVGDYWFMYTWGRTDGSGNIIHESPPSRNNTTKQINITEPINFDRHPLVYTNRPLSSDNQVGCGVLYAIGGSLVNFWALVEIMDNTTATATLYNIGDNYANRILVSKHNEPAPAGTDIVLLYNKIWMVGDSAYSTLLRSSDILLDGTIASEGWPTRNAYELDNNHGALSNIKVLNKSLSIKGLYGDWSVRINDPTDFLQVVAEKVSDNGLLGQDAVVVFPTSHVYPSNGGFVETSGAQANYILPEIEPLIDANISSAIGVNAGLVSYFTYNNATYGNRTAKVDLYRGKPRFSNLNNILFTCLTFDKISKTTYGIVDGAVYIADSGYTNEATPNKELLAYIKSKAYRPGNDVAWYRVGFSHNTGGTWYRLEIYVDDVLKGSYPFMSASRTEGDFRFGPFSGHDFQFVITSNYKAFGKIYFPIGVYHSGE